SGLRWGRALDDFSSSYGGIALDSAGNVFLNVPMDSSLPGPDFGGGSLTSTGASDFVLASYAPDNAYRYARNMGGIDVESASEVEVHADGRILLLGAHRGSMTVDTVSHTASSVNGDVFLLEMTP